MTADRPRAVRHHLRRPLYWLALEVLVSLVVLVYTAQDARTARREANSWPHVSATVRPGYREGRHKVPLTFRHPVTGQIVETETVVVRTALLPHPGGQLTVASDPASPDRVRVPHDGDEMAETAISLAVVTGVVLAVVIARRFGARQVDRLIGSGQPSFSMLGSLSRSPTNHRRVVLSLFALDARPGAKAVCSYAVLTTAWVPVGPAFPIDVRGRPVPGGVVAARAGAAVFWPLRRPFGRSSVGRPASVAAGPLVPPPAPTSLPTIAEPSLLGVIGRKRIIAAAAAVLVLTVSACVLTVRGRAAEEVRRNGTVVWAEPVSSSDGRSVLYGPPGEPRLLTASISTNRQVGRIYPAHLYPSRPSTLRLDADPYNLVGPIWSLFALAAVPIMLVGLRAGQWREVRRSLRHGPLAAATLRRSATMREIELAAMNEGTPVAWFADPGEVPAGDVVIAGTPDPGQPLTASSVDGGWATVLLPPRAKGGGRFGHGPTDRRNR